jgi:predicted deacylase
MRNLKMIPGGTPEPVPFTLLERFLWLRSDHAGSWYPAVAVNEAVKAGQNLGCVKDCEGYVLQTAVSPADGVILFMVSSLAINQTDPLLAVGA